MDDFVSVADLQAYMGLDEEPANADLAVAAAQAIVRSYIGQEITFVEDDEEFHDGRLRDRIRLRQRPVRDVTEVSEDGQPLPDSAYHVDGAIIKRVDFLLFNSGNDNIKVTYDHGWDVPDTSEPPGFPVPADIILVTLSIAARTSRNAQLLDPFITGETIGNYSYTRDARAMLNEGTVLLAEAAVLDRYAVRLIP